MLFLKDLNAVWVHQSWRFFVQYFIDLGAQGGARSITMSKGGACLDPTLVKCWQDILVTSMGLAQLFKAYIHAGWLMKANIVVLLSSAELSGIEEELSSSYTENVSGFALISVRYMQPCSSTAEPDTCSGIHIHTCRGVLALMT